MTSLAGTRSASVEQQVYVEQVRLLFQHGAVAILINGAAGVLLALLVGPHVPRTGLVAWGVVFASAWSLRGGLYLWHARSPERLPPKVWQQLFAAGTFVAGCAWGLSALWLFSDSLIDRFLVAVVIMGLAAGAAASLSCVRGIYSLYILPAFLPIALRFAFEGGAAPPVVIAFALLYAGGLSYAASMNYRALAGSLRLRFVNLALARQLEAAATHDPLTGLPNRVMLADRLSEALRRAKRSREAVAVLFLDCDGFKAINDRFGHGGGDAYLVHVARVLESSVRETDTVARLGGDEFIVMMDRCGDRAAIEAAVARVREHLRRPVVIGEVPLEPRLSIGVAIVPQDGSDAETLVRTADQAMYVAKRRGGDAISFAS